MSKFVHIDIAADDPQRAAGFYREVFDWSVQKLEGPTPYWLVATDPGDPAAVGAGIAQRSEPWQAATPTIEVASADETIDKVKRAGGTIVVPKTTIPGVGLLVTFKDTEGNVMAALEPDRNNPFVAPTV